MRRSLIYLGLIAAMAALGGCSGIVTNKIAEKMVAAPNQTQPQKYREAMQSLARSAAPLYSEQFKVAVGPPPAKIAVAVIEPRNYEFSSSQSWKKPWQLAVKWRVHGGINTKNPYSPPNKNESIVKRLSQKRALFTKALPKLPVCQARGTILLVPAYGNTKEQFLGFALDFANHGYRVVLVDLRGQGQSSGKYVTYGLVEHRDIMRVISTLYKRNLVVGKLALVGFSEGSVAALNTAAADKRVDAVVAVGPFTNLEKEMYRFINIKAPGILAKYGVSKEEFAHGFVKAGQMAGVNLARANPMTRVGQIEVPALYITGGKDGIALAAGVKKLAARTPDSKLIEFLRYTHDMELGSVAKVGSAILEFLAPTMGPSPDPACLTAPPPTTAHYNFVYKQIIGTAPIQSYFAKLLNSGNLSKINPENFRMAVNLPQGVQMTGVQVKFLFSNVGANRGKLVTSLPFHTVPASQALAPAPVVGAAKGVWTYYGLTDRGRGKFNVMQSFIRTLSQGNVTMSFHNRSLTVAHCGDLQGKTRYVVAILLTPQHGYAVWKQGAKTESQLRKDTKVICTSGSSQSR